MSTPIPRVLIIGGSFAGLFAAAAAARAGAEVTVVERDRLTDHAQPRPGVPQGVQPHVLLHRGLLAAEALLPGFEDEVLDAGGLRLDTGRMPWLGRYGWTPTDVRSYDILSVSRPVLELIVRRQVLAMPGIRLRDGFRVTGLEQSAEAWTVRSAAGESVCGDVVVDASGRGSRLPRWLDELGYPVPEPEILEAKLGYASRRYQGPEPPPLHAGLVIVATPESPVGATILPIEAHQWLVLVAGYGDRRPSRDTEQFAEFLTSLRDRAAVDLVSRLRPLGDVAVYRQTGNRRLPYGRTTRWPRGLLVIGDALCAFNPIFGQGITVAAVQAELLGEAIMKVRDVASTRLLQRRLLAATALPWSVATSEDVRQPTSNRPPTFAQRLLARWTDRMSRLAVSGDPACIAALTEVYQLVGVPRLLFSPRVVATVVRSCLLGVPPLPPRPAVLDRLTAQPAPSGLSTARLSTVAEARAMQHDRSPVGTIDDVVEALQRRLDDLPAGLDHRRVFIETYRRTTQAVGAAVDAGYFEDPEWVTRWDVAFAEPFLRAHDADLAGGEVARPWRLAFAADPKLPVLAHLLLGMNAHINYDLPPAMLSVITDEEFNDRPLLDRRRRDHERIDRILASRVAAEDVAIGGPRSLLDRLLKPLNRLSSRRFLREARRKVWLNVGQLQTARVQSETVYTARLGELELLSAAKIADLLTPGPVLLRLAAIGFGVTLPPP